MLFAGSGMERAWFLDVGGGGKEIYVVVVFYKMRWSWWCGSCGEGGAV